MNGPPTPRQTFWIGVLALAGGLYFSLVGLAVLPVPGGRDNLHGPLWLALAIGVAAALAGVSALIQVAGGANARAELPRTSPRWMHVAQYLIFISLFVCLAALGSWVAFGAGDRQFSGSLPLHGSANEWVGRTVFGIGAVIAWFGAAAAVVIGARKLLRRNTTT